MCVFTYNRSISVWITILTRNSKHQMMDRFSFFGTRIIIFDHITRPNCAIWSGLDWLIGSLDFFGPTFYNHQKNCSRHHLNTAHSTRLWVAICDYDVSFVDVAYLAFPNIAPNFIIPFLEIQTQNNFSKTCLCFVIFLYILFDFFLPKLLLDLKNYSC